MFLDSRFNLPKAPSFKDPYCKTTRYQNKELPTNLVGFLISSRPIKKSYQDRYIIHFIGFMYCRINFVKNCPKYRAFGVKFRFEHGNS